MDEPSHPSLQGAPGQLRRRVDVDFLHVADSNAGMVADGREMEDRVPRGEQWRVRGRIADVSGEQHDFAALVQKSPDQVTSQEA
jgi:hypothetical protein